MFADWLRENGHEKAANGQAFLAKFGKVPHVGLGWFPKGLIPHYFAANELPFDASHEIWGGHKVDDPEALGRLSGELDNERLRDGYRRYLLHTSKHDIPEGEN